MATDTIFPVPDLVGRPGASRRVAADFAVPEGLQLPLSRVNGALHLEGLIESVVDGILVRGALTVPLELTCARCLTTFDDTITVPVTELYADREQAEDADVEEGYELDGDRINLDALLRDAIAEAVPAAPHCRPDCRGLCPSCGVNRNEVDCDCVEETADPRWAALESLRLPEADPGAPPRR